MHKMLAYNRLAVFVRRVAFVCILPQVWLSLSVKFRISRMLAVKMAHLT